jgi:alanine-synthesizing transaminase
MNPKQQFHFHRFDRLPPYVFAEVTSLLLDARRAGRDVVDLGMGNPDLPTPPHIVEKIREVAANPRTHRYSSSRGIPNLRAAICDWYARRYDVGFGAAGDGHVRFSLVENEQRIRQAVRSIRRLLQRENSSAP